MPVITETVRKNVEKCKKCTFRYTRDSLKQKIDKNGVYHEQAEVAVESIMKISCNMCPLREDFEKMYGVKPWDDSFKSS